MERPPPVSSSSQDVSAFLNRLETQIERLDDSFFLAWWNLYAGKSPAGTERWDHERARLLGRDELLEFLRGSLDRPHPPLLGRRLELTRRVVEDALVEQHVSVVQIRSRLTRKVMAFRPRWEGRRRSRAEVAEVLRNDADRTRRRSAYFALHQIDRDVEPGLRELVMQRNSRARALGYRSFVEFRLGSEGIPLRQLESFIDTTLRAAERPVREIGDDFRGKKGNGFYPWDAWYAREQAQSLPGRLFPGRTMVRDTLAGIRAWGFRGKPRPFRIVQRSIPTGGMTLAVKIPNDVRVVVNPKGGWLHYLILFHEFGHAVESTYTRGSTHLLRGPENVPGFGGFREGMGALFEKIASDVNWLRTRPGLTEQQVAANRRVRRSHSMWGAATTAYWVRNEIELYRHPSDELATAFHRRERSTCGYDEYPVSSFADPFWVESAFYGKSYLLAGLVAEQLLAALREQVGGPMWPNRSVIPWLSENWFRHGARFDWVPRMREVTGRPFGVKDFLAASSADS
jgi:hypothetical protein